MSLSIEVVEANARARWEELCAGTGGDEIGHDWAYLELLGEVFGLEVVRLAAVRNQRWVALLPLVVQRSILGTFVTSVPYLNYSGVLGEDLEARQALANAAREHADRLRADRLELRGRHGADLPIEVWSGKSAYVLELPGDQQATWKHLGSKLRSQIRRPIKEGYICAPAGAEGPDEFYQLLARRWHELGSPILPRRFFEGLCRALPDKVEILIVKREGQVVAAGLIMQSGDTVEIPWAAAALEHNRFAVNMLLYWTAIERAIARGAARFDFGRSTPGTGNAKFKLQWGAVEQPLDWNVYASSKKGRAGERGAGGRSLVAAVWRKMPGFVARQLGPRLAARIPL